MFESILFILAVPAAFILLAGIAGILERRAYIRSIQDRIERVKRA
jgi:hypothetical protein